MVNAIIIFTRLPCKGKVKTRLAKTKGENFAVKFHRTCAEHTFNECKKLISDTNDVYIFYSDVSEKEKMKRWAGKNFSYHQQEGADIGERMCNAFKIIFGAGAKKIILIGTDIPDISSQLITKAVISLDNYDAVLGPAMDGGYYLIGMKKMYDFLFKKINWSTDKVLSDTIIRLKKNNIKTKLIKKLFDIDTEENLENWQKETG